MNFRRDGDSLLDYVWDWSGWMAEGDELDTAEMLGDLADEPEDDGLVLEEGPIVGDGRVTVWLSGGTAGRSYRLTCRVTTTQGRIDDRTAVFRVAER